MSSIGCEICGKLAHIHLTEVVDGTPPKNVEHHYCDKHVPAEFNTGRPIAAGERTILSQRYTERARKAFDLANQEAHRLNHAKIETEHILLGLLKEGSGVGATAIHNLGIDLHKARTEIEKLTTPEPHMVTTPKLPWSPRTKMIIENAMEEARNLGHNYVGTEHLLLGLLREKHGIAAQVLQNLSVNLQATRVKVLSILGAAPKP